MEVAAGTAHRRFAMPVSRKVSNPTPTPPTTSDPLDIRRGSDRLPGRIVLYVLVRDESGSMGKWRQRQGEFIPAVAAHLLEVGGPKVGDLVYILYCVVSGGVVTTEFTPLGKAADPEFNPDGQTPIGRALKAVAQKCEAFLESKVYPQEVTVRNFEILLVSDLQATGETDEETESGVRDFLELVKKHRGNVTVVGPDPGFMNDDLAKKLDVSERGVKYLDSDPRAVLNITFDSLLAASRPALGGSNPTIRIR
jgi:hypothetical protein